jgi:hypothetical protein
MASLKVTFTLDETTVKRLNAAAGRRRIPKSQAVREAIDDYHAKTDPWGPQARQRKLLELSEYLAKPPGRSRRDADRELREIRESRKRGWLRRAD